MKLPQKIYGKNRIRDGAIVLFYKRDGMDYDQLAEKFKLTERRILQILAKNHAFIQRDKEWEKEKRINRLIKRLKNIKPTEKDELDVLAELRKELEGDKVPIVNSKVNVFPTKTIVFTGIEDANNQEHISAIEQSGAQELYAPESEESNRLKEPLQGS